MVEEEQIPAGNSESIEDINRSDEMKSDEAYGSGKHSKVKDFFIGFGIYVGLVLLFGTIGILFLFLLSLNFMFAQIFVLPFNISFPLIFTAPLIISILIANKKFSNRRFVRVGVLTGFVIPIIIFLVLFGMCIIALSEL